MTRYIVELEGSVELEAEDEMEAEIVVQDFLHGDLQTVMQVEDIDVNFTILDVKEVD